MSRRIHVFFCFCCTQYCDYKLNISIFFKKNSDCNRHSDTKEDIFSEMSLKLQRDRKGSSRSAQECRQGSFSLKGCQCSPAEGVPAGVRQRKNPKEVRLQTWFRLSLIPGSLMPVCLNTM